MKKSVTWLIFSGISLFSLAALIGMYLLLAPFRHLHVQDAGNAMRQKLGLEKSLPVSLGLQKSLYVREAWTYNDGTVLIKASIPEQHGQRLWLLFFSKNQDLVLLRPLLSVRDSVLYRSLKILDTTDNLDFAPSAFEGTRAHLLDTRLLQKTLQHVTQELKKGIETDDAP